MIPIVMFPVKKVIRILKACDAESFGRLMIPTHSMIIPRFPWSFLLRRSRAAPHWGHADARFFHVHAADAGIWSHAGGDEVLFHVQKITRDSGCWYFMIFLLDWLHRRNHCSERQVSDCFCPFTPFPSFSNELMKTSFDSKRLESFGYRPWWCKLECRWMDSNHWAQRRLRHSDWLASLGNSTRSLLAQSTSTSSHAPEVY